MKVPQLSPFIGAEEYEAIKSVVETGWITEGPISKEFSEKLLKLIDSKYGVFTPNGTLAIYLGLKAMGIRPGDEVIVPDFTFIASATAVEMIGATPVFVDVNRRNFQIDLSSAGRLVSKKTKAIMPVHVYGTVCDMEEVLKFAKKYKLMVIEDAAEAIAVHYKEKHAGTFGDVGCFSFFADKTITTGEGGFIVTDNEEIYENLMYLRNQGRVDRGSFIHPRMGYNFRMTDIQNAMGLVQFGKLDEIINRKKHIHELYMKNLKGIKGLQFFGLEKGADWVPFRMVVLCNNAHELMAFMKSREIEPRTFFYPLHRQPAFSYLKNNDSDFPNAIYGYEHGVCLPIFPSLTDAQVEYVCATIKEFQGRDIFYKYYDSIFQNKDYRAETDLLYRFSNQFGLGLPRKILEIGCGTGNHTLELSKSKNTDIIAIDIDSKMVEIAKKKLARKRNVKILKSAVEEISGYKFDLVLAMFNVVNYISGSKELESFFGSVYSLLEPGGIFVFDCWNGVAVVKDPPKSKVIKLKVDGKMVKAILKTETDYIKGVSTLVYDFEVEKKNARELGTYRLDHTLWTPREFFSVLKKVEFEVVRFSTLKDPDGQAKDTDWKVMFCARRPK